jgi:exonuclease III
MHTHSEVGRGEKQLMLNVSTQNVGGLGLEVRNRQRKGVTGPKLQYLRHCVNIENTDVLVLTETRARTTEESQATYIKKSGLAVTMCTSSGRAAAGVTVLTGPQLHIVEGSIRDAYNSWGGIFG